MELRNCNDLHFIQAISGDLVLKICNVDSHGKPGLVFKKVIDIYEAEDAKDLERPSTSQVRYSEVFHCDRVTESRCVFMVERKTREKDLVTNEFTCSGSDDEQESDSDEHGFGNMTLEQLKERCKTKKRKFSNYAGLTPKQEPVEDEFDLKESLRSLKLKLSKNSKAKRKCTNKSVCTSSKVACPIRDFLALIPIKAEVPEPEFTEFQNMTCLGDDSFISLCEQVDLCDAISGKILQTIECDMEKKESISFAEECQNCAINEISYDYIDPAEPTSLFPLIGKEIMEVENQEKSCQQSLVLPLSELMKEEGINHPLSQESFLESISLSNNESSEVCNSSHRSSYLHEISEQSSSCAGVQVSGPTTDNSLCCIELHYGGDLLTFCDEVKEDSPSNQENGYLSRPISKCGSSLNSHSRLSSDIDLVSVGDDSPSSEDKQPLISTMAVVARNSLNPDSLLVVLEDDAPTDEKFSLMSVNIDAERNSCSDSHPSDVTDELLTSELKNIRFVEQCKPPERILSTRKAISPTSQERLCLAMDSVELYDDVDNYKRKGKLWLGKHTYNKASPMGPDIDGSELSTNPGVPVRVNWTSNTTSPKQILKKLKNNRKSSPPKKGSLPEGSFESPLHSRSLPRFSTGCTSIQNCSASAIAFSQRQMHDFEYLAIKLMTELKSMKNIVEEKLFYEAYRSTVFKNDADEVKTSIKNATKAEESARKWLSMMSRDCNRFCKIMRLTGNGATASESAIHKERKKITFADEAGGALCHVKFFDDGMPTQNPISENQELEAI